MRVCYQVMGVCQGWVIDHACARQKKRIIGSGAVHAAVIAVFAVGRDQNQL